FARQVLYFLGGVTLLTLTHPELTRTTLLVVPFVVGAAVFFGRRLRKVSTGVQDRIAEATAVAEEAFAQIGTVQSFGQEAAVGAARRVFELLDTQPAIADPPDPRPLPQPVRGDVALDNVSFQYQPELPFALERVSVRLAPGEVVALVGPSGAGKTTLANLLP